MDTHAPHPPKVQSAIDKGHLVCVPHDLGTTWTHRSQKRTRPLTQTQRKHAPSSSPKLWQITSEKDS